MNMKIKEITIKNCDIEILPYMIDTIAVSGDDELVITPKGWPEYSPLIFIKTENAQKEYKKIVKIMDKIGKAWGIDTAEFIEGLEKQVKELRWKNRAAFLPIGETLKGEIK